MELELLIPIIDNFLHSSAFYKERLTQVADIAHYGRKHAQVRMHWLNGELAMGPFITVAPGRSVVPHGIDRGLDPDEMLERGSNVDSREGLPLCRPGHSGRGLDTPRSTNN
jgi:hypothetical protein